MAEYSFIGNPELRPDALEKVTGEAKFTPDIQPKGMLYGKILGSPIAHGYIKKIDTSKAEALPGVMAVVTGMDATEKRTLGGYLKDRHLMCREKVRFVGDAVAAVAATTEQIAKEALKLIEVEYEPLPYVLDPEEAFDKNCQVEVHKNVWDYEKLELHGVAHRFDKERPNQVIHRLVRHGDTDEGFEEADLVLETQRYQFPYASHCFMEPHAAVAEPHSDGSIDIWASEQGGKLAKYTVASSFDIPSSKVHLHIPYLGGGFGGKTGCPLTPAAVMLARKANRPVKVVQTREEVFSAGNPRSPGVLYIKDGYKKDGTLVARKITAYINCGAYSTYSLVMLDHSVYGASGTYRQPNLTVDAYGIYTNTLPTGPYRALGCEMFVYAIERNMDKAGELLGIDKLEIRKKNLLVNGDVDGHGQVTRNNESMAAIQKAAEYIKWGTENKKADGPWRYGKGLSLGNKFTAFGETGAEASCTVRDDCSVEIRVFHCEMGQGALTVDAQAAAEELKLPMSKIKILNEHSEDSPFDEGTYCSRGTYVNGNAVMKACQDAKKQLFHRASEILEVAQDQLDTADGAVFEKANPSNKITFGQLFKHGGWSKDSSLVGRGTFIPFQNYNDPENCQGEPVLYYSYGAWGIEVKVNIETGEVVLLDCGGYYDAGEVVNKATCEGQIEGAFSMGLGQAIFEEVLINDKGKVINGNFRDYKIPTFMDGPARNNIHVGFVGKPFETGPHGAKGIGEVAMIPVMPAVANAINDAVGIELCELPLTRERVLNAIKANTQ